MKRIMNSLLLKLELPFENNIWFKGFLPERKEDRLQFSLRDGKYQIVIYLSDRSQLRQVSKIPYDPEELKNYMNIYCGALTMEIEVLNPDPKIINGLESSKSNEKTEEFVQEIFNVIIDVYTGIIDYFRNIHGQHWLEPFSQERSIQDYFDFYFEVRWLAPTGEWRRLKIFQENNFYYVIHLATEEGLDRSSWSLLPSFIKNKAFLKTPLRKILIANSYQHLDQNNDRIAIIEAVIAWETTVRQFLPNILDKITIPKEIRESIDLLLKKKKFSLRTFTYVGLRLLMNPLGLEIEDIELINEAVEQRNNIIHGPSRKTNIEPARRYVATIKKIIDLFENLE